ncbi:hypothetical protein BT69DRAFT_1241314 [Atractiella rhizophila]|nr:hypothetical protein BT69DRAFT_1241314 [Atractiella rhizophila]
MSTFDGIIREIPGIKVDNFTIAPSSAPIHFFFLSHVHSDHLTGLESTAFHGQIFCSHETAEMLPELKSAQERVKWFEGMEGATKGKRLYGHLKERKGRSGGKKLWALEKDRRHELELDGESLFVTLLDANHMVGAVMFLFEWKNKAVLYTGDVRAEPHLLRYLSKNPVVARYLATKGSKTLDKIYLDTSMVLCNQELVSKEQATLDLVHLIELYPPNTKFFLNAWTPGYEEILTSISLHFDEKIHLDPYKHSLYNLPSVVASHPSLSLLSSLQFCCAKPHRHLASGPSSICSCGYPSFPCPCTCKSTRFHACERKWKCDAVWGEGMGTYEVTAQHVSDMKGRGRKGKLLSEPGTTKLAPKDENEERIVYVSPFDRGRDSWRKEFQKKKQELEELRMRWRSGEIGLSWPDTLCCPLARHSTLPELRDLVRLFKPASLYPNTISSRLHYMDYEALPLLFKDCLAPGADLTLRRECAEEKAQEGIETYRKRANIAALEYAAGRVQWAIAALESDVSSMKTMDEFLNKYGVADPLDLHDTRYLVENTEGDEAFNVREERRLEQMREQMTSKVRNSHQPRTLIGNSPISVVVASSTKRKASDMCSDQTRGKDISLTELEIERTKRREWNTIKRTAIAISIDMRKHIRECEARGEDPFPFRL